MRKIELSLDEIETIKTALEYVYNRKMEFLGQNRTTLSHEAKKSILDTANKYLDTQSVFDGTRDV